MSKFFFLINEKTKTNLQYGKPIIDQRPLLKFIAGLVTGLVMLFSGMDLSGQVPTRFNQQVVVRDTTGQVVANRSLRLRVSLEQMVGGAAVMRYREMHQVTTNSNGLYTVEVGGGSVELGQMDSVRWDLGSVYLKTEVDPSGGQNYILSSNRELLSVPYALHAKTAEVPGLPGPAGPQGIQGPQGPQGSFPSGTQQGEMSYWDGSSWVMVPPGARGQSLIFCDSVPTWGGCGAQVLTNPVTSIFSNRATTGGVINSDGGSPVTARGVVYGNSQNPTLSDNLTTNGAGIGSFSSSLTSILPLTGYYVRAYATNSNGTTYGNQVTFSTSSTPFCGSTIADIDGNIYNTVQIGTQCWTQRNLNVTKYRNGDSIPNMEDNTQWSDTYITNIGGSCTYNNTVSSGSLWGRLYNWYAISDPRGLCPAGWHVPSDGEWTILVDHLGGSGIAGGPLKSTQSQPVPRGWGLSTGATNTSGFSGLPGGWRSFDGGWSSESGNMWTSVGYVSATRLTGYWWSSTDGGSVDAWSRDLYFDSTSVGRQVKDQSHGFSVRCIRD
jgi:uncharacterized protein (TIGR02145 family)